MDINPLAAGPAVNLDNSMQANLAEEDSRV